MQTLQTIIRWLPGVVVIFAIFAIAFPKRASTENPEWVPAQGSESSGIAGQWAWVESRQGDEVRRPTAAADSLVMGIGAYGGYREYVEETLLRSRYWIAEGTQSVRQDTTYTVLVFDSSSFFPRNGEIRAAAVRNMTPDSLFLSGVGTDATLHTFIRVQARQ